MEIHFTHNTPLPCRDDIMPNSNKQHSNTLLCGYDLREHLQLVRKLDSVVTHTDSNITIHSYMFKVVLKLSVI